ncbi:hypothetical protein [Micromonospora zhanjiangensis]|uniref:Uncharacterized protein n=1 Tax=Micromonospora zhanjiangensis TaxID=1522057 RepID=A0ABV8KIS2_9ACTN
MFGLLTFGTTIGLALGLIIGLLAGIMMMLHATKPAREYVRYKNACRRTVDREG